MKISCTQFLFLAFISYATLFGQSMCVDMNPVEQGIQSVLTSFEEGKTIIVDFICADFASVAGYQFKIAFDSSKFEFKGGDEDYGLSGTKNILKKNNGTTTGFFQKQANPPCDSILDVAYTITGTVDLSVSGTGLIGIAQFKSKAKFNDTGYIKITEGYWVSFNGVKTPITTFTNGFHAVLNPVFIKNKTTINNSMGPIVTLKNKELQIIFPVGRYYNNLLLSIFNLKGENIITIEKINSVERIASIPLSNLQKTLSNGYYIISLNSTTFKSSHKIVINN